MPRRRALIWTVALLGACASHAQNLQFRQRILSEAVRRVPEIMAEYHEDTGRFVSGRAWDLRRQQRMYVLALLYCTQAEANRYYHDPKLLAVVVRAGDALVGAQDDRGRFEFVKGDGSRWGWRYDEWTYSRWADTFELIRGDMAADDRGRWQAALELGCRNMHRYLLMRLDSELIDNHRVEMAAAVYAGGQVLGRPEWCQDAAAYMMVACAQQSPNGYWSEGGGPVILYNFEYIGSLGRYYARSGDERVLPAIERAARFHYRFTYPDGHAVETLDGRNWFSGAVNEAWEAFSLTPVGRAYLLRQWSQPAGQTATVEMLGRLLQWGREGPCEPQADLDAEQQYIMPVDGVPRAMVVRRGPWYVCLCALVTPVAQNRFYLDRQNFVSIYHDKLGLIVGGGNGKLQPAWSNFTVGDSSLLQHTPGDEDPTFTPRGEFFHVPYEAQLVRGPLPGLVLCYGRETCRVNLDIVDDATLDYVVSSTTVGPFPVEAHVTLLPRLENVTDEAGRPMAPSFTWVRKPIAAAPCLLTATGGRYPLTSARIDLRPEQIGGWIEYGGYRLSLPDTAGVHWPAVPHNGYRKNGAGRTYEGRIEVRVPLDAQHPEHRLRLKVLD